MCVAFFPVKNLRILSNFSERSILHLVLKFIDNGLTISSPVPRLIAQFSETKSPEAPSLRYLKGFFRFQKNKIDNKRCTCNYDGDIIQTQSLECLSEQSSEVDDLPLIENNFYEDSMPQIKKLITISSQLLSDPLPVTTTKDTLSSCLKQLDSSSDLEVFTTLDQLAKQLYTGRYKLSNDISTIKYFFHKYFLDKTPILQQVPQYVSDRSKHLVHFKHQRGYYNFNLVSNSDNLISHYDRKEKYQQPMSRFANLSYQIEKRKHEHDEYQQRLQQYQNSQIQHPPTPLQPSFYDRQFLKPIKGGLQAFIREKAKR